MALSRAAQCSEALGGALLQLDAEGLSPAHMALLLDVAADAAEARLHGAMSADLVWTGPEAPASHSRDTAVVVEELFSNAQRQVLVSSFVVRQGDVVFKPLADRMAEVPDLRVRLFLHVPRGLNDTRDESELLREFAYRFPQEWPWPQRPEIYYDPRLSRQIGQSRRPGTPSVCSWTTTSRSCRQRTSPSGLRSEMSRREFCCETGRSRVSCFSSLRG